ncbi:CotH kinase family protein [Humisphaera borealis]|uniref:CotH kinase family protein n=1 Tax=Humisphaera borealis TaxID=2807512 RepID=A0A7M2WWF8_9BACT|nr:CotH kinase family protein [Humisphaera borealis]QOV88840.1 CotH kinase family protein [Humisphaera borealis]
MDRQSPSRREILTFAVSAAIASVLPEIASGKSLNEQRNELFDGGKILTLAIEIDNDGMKSLREDTKKYVKAQIKEDGQPRYKNVGVKLKGAAGSMRGVDDKPGWTLNMDKFEDGQRFWGMDKLHLNNCVQDPSYISEGLCGEMYRAAGVPASRLTNAIVSLNGRKLGFYAIKEGYDKGFLKNHFGSTDGNFYDGGFLRDLDQPLENNNEGKDPAKDHADLKSLMEVSQEADLQRRFDRMSRRLDIDKFVSYLSLQMLTWDWDGYPMNRNNYRIYHDPKTNLLTFLPSGMDQMFGDPNGPLFPNAQGVIAQRFLETPEGKKRYFARTEQLLADVFVPDRWSKRLDELLARVQPALKQVSEGAAKDLPGQFDRIRDGIKQRAKKIKEDLAKSKAKK